MRQLRPILAAPTRHRRHPLQPSQPSGPASGLRRRHLWFAACSVAALFALRPAAALPIALGAGRSLPAALAAAAPAHEPAVATPADPTRLDLAAVLARHAAATPNPGHAPRPAAVHFDLLIEEGGQALRARYVADARVGPVAAGPTSLAAPAIPSGRTQPVLGTFAGRMRIDLYAGNDRVFSEGYDGREGWSWPGGEDHAAPASPPAVAALRRGVELPDKIFALHELPARGHHLELTGFVAEAGRRFAVIELTLADGFSAEYWLDTASWMIARRRDHRPHHVDLDPRPITIETRFEDYRLINGTPFAHRSIEVELPAGKVLSQVTVLAIELDPPVESTSFARP